MFIQSIYNDSTPDALFDFIEQNPLGIFTTGFPSDTHAHPQSSHIPWVLDRPSISASSDQDGPPPSTKLRGHLARANPQAKAMIDSLASSSVASRSTLESQVMIIFNDPHHHYVPPKFYTETVSASGKVAGTWNYAAVQVYGRAKIYHDTKNQETHDFLTRQLYDLSDNSEKKIMGFTGENGREEPWNLDDVPRSYMDILKRAIVGIEIIVDRIDGKFKMSQKEPKGDR
ncbi:transcriptional regulator PAI 2-type [Aspergillus crustosus]